MGCIPEESKKWLYLVVVAVASVMIIDLGINSHSVLVGLAGFVGIITVILVAIFFARKQLKPKQ